MMQIDISRAIQDPILYLPFRQEPRRSIWVLARTHLPPASLAKAARRAIQSGDVDLPARDIMALDTQLALSTWPLRIFGSMFAVFAGIALLLAAVDLYAVMAHMVSQRTHEIGVRIALGASQRGILGLVFNQNMR